MTDNMWSSRKSIALEHHKPVIGILVFEVSRLMSKVVNLWQCLSERQIVKLREEIVNSVGIRKLVSEDDDYLMVLALAEIIENLGTLGKSVAILGKKCMNPVYHNLKGVFNDPGEIDINWCGWQYRLKKMERKVKKMERFVAATEQLCQELEVLAELEQSLRRMRAGADLGQVKLLEFQQKVARQQQEVKNLKEMSPWVRTFDYIVRLLLRSLFTIVPRIKHFNGINQIGNAEGSSESEQPQPDCFIRSNSFSARMQSSVFPSENYPSKFPGSLRRSFSNLGLDGDKSRSRNKKLHNRSQSFILYGKQPQMKARSFAFIGFKGCMTGGSDSHVVQSYKLLSNGTLGSTGTSQKYPEAMKDTNAVPILSCNITSPKESFFISKLQLLNIPRSTLCCAALALHYANIIILIEKLASSPHLISLDARDDLYIMLPTSIRSCLRAKLKLFSQTSVSSNYDAAFAKKWRLAPTRILEWLSPLAHNTVRWHCGRNSERKQMIVETNVFLVQTLYFANQVETEALIVELLVGLNYLSRFGREINEKPF
ncbi:Protein of unknown function (DUF668) [Abeliophyllum distichum]|uniref:DUF668 domain-containing protein n=1 Tax=Abeliophyllum distichum TaxID=126358 RepID=A0ABD1V8A2_9LAMI